MKTDTLEYWKESAAWHKSQIEWHENAIKDHAKQLENIEIFIEKYGDKLA